MIQTDPGRDIFEEGELFQSVPMERIVKAGHIFSQNFLKERERFKTIFKRLRQFLIIGPGIPGIALQCRELFAHFPDAAFESGEDKRRGQCKE